MSVTAVRTPAEYENELRRYRFERAEESRAVRVGEKEVSEQAAIVARYAHLYSSEQLAALRRAEEEADDADERERLYRLRKTCEAGIVDAEVTEQEDELQNAILAARIAFRGEEMPLRTAQAKMAVLPEYADREELGDLYADANATFNDDRRALLETIERLEAEVSGIADPVERNEEIKTISLRELSEVLADASARSTDVYQPLRDRWFDKLLGERRDDVPSMYHVAYLRRLSPLEATYTKERATEICLRTLRAVGFDLESQPNIKLDLEDRPQKSPRASVIPSDPPEVVHLITRAQGGLHDYEAFLHEAGHALHYGGCDPELPYTFRAVSRDHALTEIYSYIIASITKEPGWHELHFELSPEQAAANAEAAHFVETLLFRRYVAKLGYELEFWSSFWDGAAPPERYEELLTEATGVRYRGDYYLSDMDAGFYAADYLRAWIRSAQLRDYLRREIGGHWWQDTRTGELLRSLFTEGTKPTSEAIAARLGYGATDVTPLLAEYTAQPGDRR
jgi:hypothetical protein